MEWPREDYFYDTAYDKEAEMEMNEEYEEATWERILKDGPPKDDNIEWVKARVAYIAHNLADAKDSKALAEMMQILWEQ